MEGAGHCLRRHSDPFGMASRDGLQRRRPASSFHQSKEATGWAKTISSATPTLRRSLRHWRLKLNFRHRRGGSISCVKRRAARDSMRGTRGRRWRSYVERYNVCYRTMIDDDPSRGAARSAFSLAAPALMSSPRVLTPIASASGAGFPSRSRSDCLECWKGLPGFH
jgi:hypothetical protein